MHFFIACLMLAFSGGATLAAPTPLPETRTGLEGVITISPSHPGPIREGIASSAPLANYSFIVQKANEIVASFTTDEKGAFQISLPPGHYIVMAKDRAPRIGKFGPFEVDVVAGQVTKVSWTCDSGMR